MPKLIAFDIDGTLLNTKGEVLPSTIEAIEQLRNAGHLVTIATGRSYFLAEKIINGLNFENYLLLNGAAGFINHKQVVKELLNPESFTKLVHFSNTLGVDISYQNLYEIHRFQKEATTPIQEAMASFRAEVPSYDPEFYLENEIYQGIIYSDTSFDEAFKKENFSAFDFVRWHPYGVDVIPANNSKARGLLKMLAHEHLTVDDLIVFGDGLNDREMLQAAGTGVVMGNAVDDVKKYGNLITKTNNEDGIYHALKKLQLIQ